MNPTAVVGLSIGGGMLALAAVFFLIAYVRARTTRGWVRTTGLVVDRKSGRPDRGGTAIFPTFQWQDQHGQVHQYTSNMRQSLGPRPGTRVPVLFDPDQPHRAMIDTLAQSGRIFYPIAGALALLGLLVGGFLLAAGSQLA